MDVISKNNIIVFKIFVSEKKRGDSTEIETRVSNMKLSDCQRKKLLTSNWSNNILNRCLSALKSKLEHSLQFNKTLIKVLQ